MNKIKESRYSQSTMHKWMTPGLISHYFVGFENLEGQYFLNFVTQMKSVYFGSEFIKLTKNRVKKRSIETFLKTYIFNTNTLTFERENYLKNQSSNISSNEMIEHRDEILFSEVNSFRILYPVNRENFLMLGQKLFNDNDGVLYPVTDTSNSYFFKPLDMLVKQKETSVANSIEMQAKKKKKTQNLDDQIKDELEKLYKCLEPIKAEKRFGFSKIERIFGYVRFEDDPNNFHKVDISKNYFEISGHNKINIATKEKVIELKAPSCLSKAEYEDEPEIVEFVNSMEGSKTINVLDSQNPNFKQIAECKLFLIGKNQVLKRSNEELQHLNMNKNSFESDEILSEKSNNKDVKSPPSKNKKHVLSTVKLDTRDINELLLRQFLVQPIVLPEFKVKEEVDNELQKKLEERYQNWGLENGQFYDGYLFRNEFGVPYAYHPSKKLYYNFYIKFTFLNIFYLYDILHTNFKQNKL